MTDIVGAIFLAVGASGLGFLTCLYLVFGSTVWLRWGRD